MASPTARTSPFDQLYGLELELVSGVEARARVQAREELCQPAGLVHGGVYASIAEGLATMGTIDGLGASATAVGLSNHTSFLRPVTAGFLHALAVPRHRGRTTWVWEVEIADDQQRLCALTRMTVAVRAANQQQPSR
jgi:1,4-dihydroxy-2-naphthoyl-CoA hydrolase